MPLRPPACYRAVHHRIPTHSDALWITDDILSTTFQKFCASAKPTRRYGSHVPGPMECRRRTGRRRLAISSNSETFVRRPPLINLSRLWAALGMEEDRTKFRWEPPAATAPDLGLEDQLPKWLTDYKPEPGPVTQEKEEEVAVEGMVQADNKLEPVTHEEEGQTLVAEVMETQEPVAQEEEKEYLAKEVFETKVEKIQRKACMQEEVDEFTKLLSTTDAPEELCSSFNEKVKHNLILGLVSNDDLASCLRRVAKYLRLQKKVSYENRSRLCLRFYEAVWEGITSCKVLTPQFFKGRVLNRFMIGMSHVKHSAEVEHLTGEVLRVVSEKQLLRMTAGFREVAKTWALSWMQGLHVFDTPEMDPTIKASVLALANAFNLFPREEALDIVRQLTRTFRKNCQSTRDGREKLVLFRYSWLNVVARVKGVEENLLIEIWQAIDPLIGERLRESALLSRSTRALSLDGCCDIILSHWITCDLIEDPTSLLVNLDTLMYWMKPPIHKFSCLIAAVDHNRDLAWQKSKSLFRILHRLGLHSAISETLHHLSALEIKYPTLFLSSQITAITPKDFNSAFRIYKLYPKLRLGRVCLTTRLDGQHPDFYLQMIRFEIIPQHIWCLLRIPMYHPVWPVAKFPRHRRGVKDLHPARISLIRRMAWEFAHAKHLTPRQARRNVTQCLFYLKKHRVSIKGKPDLTRALVHAAIARDMAMGKWVGTEIMQWVLRWVEIAEGEEVKERVKGVLMAWREEFWERRRWERRDANPLRVGLID